MKNGMPAPTSLPLRRNPETSDFRIDFDADTALIALPPLLQSAPFMSADLSNAPRPPGEPARPLGEISQGPGAFELFLDRNQGTLAILAVVLVIAAAGLVVYRGVADGQQKAGGAALSVADDLPSLQGVIKNHGDTVAAGSASVLLADRQWADGDQDAAIQTLRDFIANQPDHAAAPSARASLASKLASQGKRDEARAEFQAIADDPDARFLAPYALISIGDLETAAGDTKAARPFYEKARTDHPGSNFAETANRRLALLDSQAPAEIDAPPAPPTPDAAPSPGAPPMLTPPPSPFSFGTDPSEPAAPSEAPEDAATPDPSEIPPSDELAPAEPETTPPPSPADEPAEPETGAETVEPGVESPESGEDATDSETPEEP